MASPLFTIPIQSSNGSIVCTNPDPQTKNIYLLTFSSPKDNRLTPAFIDALLLALDVIEHRFARGVVITTSGIEKFYSNGLDLALALSTDGFFENWLYKLFRRFITYMSPNKIPRPKVRVLYTNWLQIPNANGLPHKRPRLRRRLHAGNVPRLPNPEPQPRLPVCE